MAHVPVEVTTDRGAVRAMAREQLGMCARLSNYRGMFAAAGYDVTGGYTDELLDDLVVWGTEEQMTAGLQRWIEAGMGKLIAQPLHGPDREASRAAAFAAVARAAG